MTNVSCPIGIGLPLMTKVLYNNRKFLNDLQFFCKEKFYSSIRTKIPPEVKPLEFDSKVFSNKSSLELVKIVSIYKACSWPRLVKWTPSFLRASSYLYLSWPLTKLMRWTIFNQFCGGETVEEVQKQAETLKSGGINVILDFAAEPDISPSVNPALSAESVSSEDAYYNNVRDNILNTVRAASGTDKAVVAVKITGLFNSQLLKEISSYLSSSSESSRFDLSQFDSRKFQSGCERLESICSEAKALKVKVVVDAEQSFVQKAIDFIAIRAMKKYNSIDYSPEPIVMNTYQMYRKDGLAELKKHCELSANHNFHFGCKIVRGAYMIGERIWAGERGTECPIFDTIEDTHKQYNDSIDFLFTYVLTLPPGDNRSFFINFATHNQFSVEKIASLYMKHFYDFQPKAQISLAQLYGMCDGITYSLAASGYPVYKYLPFGPVKDVIPYLIRRAQENSSIFQVSQSDASMILSEVKNRLSRPFRKWH